MPTCHMRNFEYAHMPHAKFGGPRLPGLSKETKKVCIGTVNTRIVRLHPQLDFICLGAELICRGVPHNYFLKKKFQ